MTGIIFSTDGEESFRIPSPFSHNHYVGTKCPETKLEIKKMTEIEKTEGEIKVLQAKLELLKEMEKHKSPVEEAYKDWWGQYPELETDSEYDEMRWQGFRAGYHFAYEEKVVEEEPEQATLYDVVRHGLEYSIDMCDEIVNSVRCWLPNEMEYDEDLNGYRAGWNDCINTLNKQLR